MIVFKRTEETLGVWVKIMKGRGHCISALLGEVTYWAWEEHSMTKHILSMQKTRVNPPQLQGAPSTVKQNKS